MTTSIKIDLDYYPDIRSLELFIDTRAKMLRDLGYRLARYTYALTARGAHIYYILEDDLGPEDTVKLQWLLGDDPVRTRINMYRARRGTIPRLNKLFDHADYRRPPSKECLRCRLWRWYVEEVLGKQPPVYETVFTLPRQVAETIYPKLRDISRVDPTFQYRFRQTERGVEVTILSSTRDQAIRRGLWVKHRLLGGDHGFTVREIYPEDRGGG